MQDVKILILNWKRLIGGSVIWGWMNCFEPNQGSKSRKVTTEDDVRIQMHNLVCDKFEMGRISVVPRMLKRNSASELWHVGVVEHTSIVRKDGTIYILHLNVLFRSSPKRRRGENCVQLSDNLHLVPLKNWHSNITAASHSLLLCGPATKYTRSWTKLKAPLIEHSSRIYQC